MESALKSYTAIMKPGEPPVIKYDVELAFYPTGKSDRNGNANYASVHDGLIVFPHKQFLLPALLENNLIGRTLRVNLSESRSPNGKGKSIAYLEGDIDKAIVPADGNYLDCEPIVLIDGQNFLRSVRTISPNISPAVIINNVISKFRRRPMHIRFYICEDAIRDFKDLYDNINYNLKRFDPNIELVKTKMKVIDGDQVLKRSIKTDIDPLIMTDIGKLSSAYKIAYGINHKPRTLVLFTGDSDYRYAANDWLGQKILSGFLPNKRGHFLTIVSSSRARALSTEMREVANDPNANLMLIEDIYWY